MLFPFVNDKRFFVLLLHPWPNYFFFGSIRGLHDVTKLQWRPSVWKQYTARILTATVVTATSVSYISGRCVSPGLVWPSS